MNNKRYATAKESRDFFKGFLNILLILTDEESQNNAWINGDYSNYHLDFIDICEAFISPCELIIDWKELSVSQHNGLKKLYDMIVNYKDKKERNGIWVPKSNAEIAHDPNWHKIRAFARNIYNDLSSLLPNK